jgi:hypothetical protein
MRKWLLAAMLGLVACTHVGCVLPIYSGDPATRTRQLIYTSEDLRAAREEWERFWFLDQPDHMTVLRTHGGIVQ